VAFSNHWQHTIHGWVNLVNNNSIEHEFVSTYLGASAPWTRQYASD